MSNDRPRILIIDNEKMTSRTMAMALEAVGYETAGAGSGRDGLRTALEQHPQLIMLDCHMEDMDGLEVLRQLRADAWGKSVPVIIASNAYGVDTINSIMELGVRDYVLKSDVNLDEIVKLAGKYVPLPSQPERQAGRDTAPD